MALLLTTTGSVGDKYSTSYMLWDTIAPKVSKPALFWKITKL